MHKYALFFEKKNWKIVAALGAPPPNPHWPLTAWGSTPRVVTPITFYSYFLKRFVALTLLASKRNKKNLEISPMFCFCYSFLTSNSAQGTLTSPLAKISGHRNNYDLYYIMLEWWLVGPSLSLPPWLKPLVTPLSGPPGYVLAQFFKKRSLTEKIRPVMLVLPVMLVTEKNLIITCFLVKFCFIQN